VSNTKLDHNEGNAEPEKETGLLGWHQTTLGEIADVRSGITKGKQRTPGEKLRKVPYLRVANVQRGYLDLSEVKEIEATEEEILQHSLQPGDVLFNEGGDRDKLGRGWVWNGEICECIHQNHVFRARIHQCVLLPKLLSWYGNSEGQTYFLKEGKQTTNLASLNSTNLRALPVSIPPVPEQYRIVAAIESYFTRLDAAVATLECVERNLKRYRASVLKSAVEGRLVPTEAALAKQERRTYETASVLLERILAERRRRWSQSGKKGKYEEPAQPDTGDLPDLPEGWCWATVDMLADLKGGITKGQKRRNNTAVREVPYLRVANVQRGYLDLAEVKTIFATDEEIRELGLEEGDVLFNEGGDRDKLGRGWIWSGELPECIHQNHVFRARILTEDVEPRYLSWYGNSSAQAYFFDQGKQTTNLASINLTKLKGLPVPLPPHREQVRLVAEVDRLLSVTDGCIADVGREHLRCQRLRQSILKWAFEGKLADQDDADEPASALLERIKAERASGGPVRATGAQPITTKKQVRA
jgi:type I restriction enzyme, S subunit